MKEESRKASILKSVNYLCMFRRSFPFAINQPATYHSLGAAMNAKFHITKFLVLAGLLFSMFPLSANCTLQAQEGRRVRTKVEPEYPELARRLNLKGVVRVEVTVAAGGSVLTVKELGGNPVLLDALVRAVKKWKYEPAERDSVVEVKFDFTGVS